MFGNVPRNSEKVFSFVALIVEAGSFFFYALLGTSIGTTGELAGHGGDESDDAEEGEEAGGMHVEMEDLMMLCGCVWR